MRSGPRPPLCKVEPLTSSWNTARAHKHAFPELAIGAFFVRDSTVFLSCCPNNYVKFPDLVSFSACVEIATPSGLQVLGHMLASKGDSRSYGQVAWLAGWHAQVTSL